MENLNKKWEFKDLISKKTGIILLIAAVSVLVIWNVYYFGWKKLENKIYQKGIEAGKLEVNTLVIQQLLTNGKIGINLPMKDGKYDPQGEIQTIFLIPQVDSTTNNSATTTQ